MQRRTYVDTDRLLQWLGEYRLRADISYDTLAARMTDAGIRISQRAVYNLLNRNVKPTERMLYKVQLFCDLVTKERRRGRPLRPAVEVTP